MEFGEDGPKVRFRIRPEDQPCKPFREICSDCCDRTIPGANSTLDVRCSYNFRREWQPDF